MHSRTKRARNAIMCVQAPAAECGHLLRGDKPSRCLPHRCPQAKGVRGEEGDVGRPGFLCWERPRWPSGKACAPKARDKGISPCFLGSSHSSDLKVGTQVTILSGAWHLESEQGLVCLVSACCDWAWYPV